jgi:hypothetical protein
MESEYLYRILYKGAKVYEGDEDNAKLFFKLVSNKEDLKLQRAQLVWWPAPPENFTLGST